MPSLATAAAAAAGAPLRHGQCALRSQTAHTCSVPSPALASYTRLAALSCAPLLVHRARPSLAAPRAASPDAATGARSPTSGGQMLVFVPPHPLIKHWVSVLRNEQTPCSIFREIQTPVAVSSVEFIDPREPIMVVPILRAGLALAEHASSILPATKTYHLGLRRDEETLQPSIYLNNLPEKIPEGTRVLVVDPMLATGGTIVAAIDLLVDRGVTSNHIKVVSAVAAPPALQKLSNKFPGLHVYTGTIDSEVDERGYYYYEFIVLCLSFEISVAHLHL
ncbi:hypothetical protein GUJ93_ZPchr0010g10283 [Zizania palustris]|uniref:uracil phosphoribosyltransferase n=1 Tax=Zizania palustris TaxID=103762 RepID=A0A8J5W9A0_ZIZPA|nr:hypothetical protein GUJ93_ZPchr0010g10283 [Zizania palustris]